DCVRSDLLICGDLLKKTSSTNLFTVFGEPDIENERAPDRDVVVTLKGLDVYDPTTGEVRPSSTNEIACWFIDTDYNEESFFVRQAYFTVGMSRTKSSGARYGRISMRRPGRVCMRLRARRFGP